MERWNMKNGVDGFAEFYATHPACRYSVNELEVAAQILLRSPDQTCFYDYLNGKEALDEIRKQGSWNFKNIIIQCASDSWIQEQYRRWFTGKDRFVTVFQYHSSDKNMLFYNWLIGNRNWKADAFLLYKALSRIHSAEYGNAAQFTAGAEVEEIAFDALSEVSYDFRNEYVEHTWTELDEIKD